MALQFDSMQQFNAIYIYRDCVTNLVSYRSFHRLWSVRHYLHTKYLDVLKYRYFSLIPTWNFQKLTVISVLLIIILLPLKYCIEFEGRVPIKNKLINTLEDSNFFVVDQTLFNRLVWVMNFQ